MELRQFLRIISRQRYAILLVCLSATLTATGLTYVISEKYQSSTKMLIRPNKYVDLVPKREEILGYPVSYYTSITTAAKTYSEIITSRAIAEKIVKSLGIDVMKESEGSGVKYFIRKFTNKVKETLVKSWTLLKYGRLKEDDPFNYAVNKVQKSLTVNPTKETYMFELESKVKSPQLAAAIANTAAEVLVEYLQESDSLEKGQARHTIQDNIILAEGQLKEARNAMVEFKEENSIVALKEESVFHLEALLDLESSSNLIRREINGLLASKKEMTNRLEKVEVFSKATTTTSNNPIVQELRLQLVQKEVDLVGLQRKYTHEHRDIQAISLQVDEIIKKLKQHPVTVNSEVVSEVNPLYQKTLMDMADLETGLKSCRAKYLALRSEISEKKNLLDTLPQKEAKLAGLKLAVELAEQKYMFISREWQELEMNANRNVPTIKLIHRAAVPLYPSSPIKIYHAGLAAFLSLIVGIGIALLKESTNVTVRSIHEAEELLSIPVLTTIPKLAVDQATEWFMMEQGRRELPEVNRKHERVCVQSRVEIKGRKLPNAIEGELVDISLGGACIRLNETQGISPEDSIDMEIDLISNGLSRKKISLEGTVLRLRKASSWEGSSTIAAVFVNLKDDSAEEIKRMFMDKSSVSSFLLPPDFEEPIRGLRSGIQAFSKDNPISFLITSSGIKDGKSTIVANLAQSLTGTNKTTVLVDANLRDPSLHKIFGLSNERGLTTFLSTGKDLSMKKVSSGLTVVTSGPSVKDPAALLGSKGMREVLESLKQNFDYVLIDAPALLAGSDSELLASIADAACIVLDAESTSMKDAVRSKEIIEKTNARIIGTIMNNYNANFESYYSFCGKYMGS